MSKTWYVVAHRAGARMLKPSGRHGALELVGTLENPAGRLVNRELESDRPGSARFGVSSGLYERHEDPHLHVATTFAREICEALEDARVQHALDEIVLVAEPRFLGMVRSCMTKQTAALVRETIARDLGHVATHDLGAHIAQARDTP